jgi:hypothetical protein
MSTLKKFSGYKDNVQKSIPLQASATNIRRYHFQMTLLAIAEKKSSRENSYDSLKTATRNLET